MSHGMKTLETSCVHYTNAIKLVYVNSWVKSPLILFAYLFVIYVTFGLNAPYGYLFVFVLYYLHYNVVTCILLRHETWSIKIHTYTGLGP